MKEQIIKVWKSTHGTTDVVIYNIKNIKVVDWFALMDIWGSRGYDRFNDDGLYFELPGWIIDIIFNLPFVRREGIRVKLGY